ncbi:hypothetical protein B0A49_06034 [Cryomyces minteri]|uniref:2EXR domain-containing protein n=1 Tax=Cryomyces minteri TaxID=331657 RepID=A0A4U0XDF1_9PEZI|nr:hypothetical protein B0A49_06034 [Cryomyces minteri]
MAITRSQTAKIDHGQLKKSPPVSGLLTTKKRRHTKKPFRARALVRAPVKCPFPFLKLPPELRNVIYNLALVECHTVRMLVRPMTKQPALARVCRQVRNECLPIYYGNNHFQRDLIDYDRKQKDPYDWHNCPCPHLVAIGNANCMMLRHLTVVTRGPTARIIFFTEEINDLLHGNGIRLPEDLEYLEDEKRRKSRTNPTVLFRMKVPADDGSSLV